LPRYYNDHYDDHDHTLYMYTFLAAEVVVGTASAAVTTLIK